jgi:hypothetical protein
MTALRDACVDIPSNPKPMYPPQRISASVAGHPVTGAVKAQDPDTQLVRSAAA